MTRLSDGAFGPAGKKLAELSDDELAVERERRLGRPIRKERPGLSRVRQYLANLELDPSATWPEIQRAYEKLRDRYHPDKHQAHPERHETAVELTKSLDHAYETLRRHFER
jgi:DnaJ-domain-containing protein 1